MKDLRIVLVMVEPPLPFGNAVGRWYYVLLKGLVERGHRVTAFATCSQPADMSAARALFPAPAYDLRCYAHPARRGLFAKWETLRRPNAHGFSPALRQDLDAELARGYDVLHLEHWSGWLAARHSTRAVLNLHYLFSLDLADRPPVSLMERFRRHLSFRAERTLLETYRTITTFTPRLSECVRAINPAADVHTVPLGLDDSLYPFPPTPLVNERPIVGLIGTFGWYPTY